MRVLLAAVLLLFSVNAWGNDAVVHGIAMHGALKYPNGFPYLDYVNPGAPKGGVIRHAVTGTFDSLNPFIVKGKPVMGLTPQLYEPLMARTWDEPFSLYGLIAERIEVPDDRASVTFTLRPEARWHDGTAITTDDVLFTVATLREHGRPGYRSFYNRIAAAERLDERRVRFHFRSNPDGSRDRELPLIMGMLPVLPKAYWSSRDFTRTTLEPPLGSGPYRIAAVDPGRSIRYERVPGWWGRDLPVNRGQHNFAVIRYDYYRDDAIALEAFKAGAVDFRREIDPGKWATGYDAPALRDGRIRREVLPHGRPEPMRALIFNMRRPMFQDRRVREALGYAFDFEWINRILFHGAYKRIASFFPNSELAAQGLPDRDELRVLDPLRADLPPELFSQVYRPPQTEGGGRADLRANLRKAASRLAEAGWVVRDGRMVEAATGRLLAFEVLLADPGDEKVVLEWARILERIGATVRVRTVDSAQYQARLEDFDYDMILGHWASTLSPGNEQAGYYGSEAADQRGSRNYAGIRNRAVDALIRGLAGALSREALLTHAHALDRALLWGHYVVPLYYLGEDRIAYWARLKRPATIPLYGFSIETWWAEP